MDYKAPQNFPGLSITNESSPAVDGVEKVWEQHLAES
jgi:hypothetical protein